MKTKLIIIGTFTLGIMSLAAQTISKPTTVRIQKTEVNNGVVTKTDTTFTTSKLDSIINDDREKNIEGRTFIMKKVKCDATPSEIDNVKEEVHFTIDKKISISDASESDMKNMKDQSGLSDNKLEINKMEFYPNPTNGKFNLRFNLKEKGYTEITIMNTEGKDIYTEKLNAFSGNYNKEIDISENKKGVYFLKISQNKRSQLKKLILE